MNSAQALGKPIDPSCRSSAEIPHPSRFKWSSPFTRSGAVSFFLYSEFHMTLLFGWVGAWIREQSPALPWRHFHPEYGRNLQDDASLRKSLGMLQICRDAGIRRGTFVGINISYIWSFDLCLTLPWIESPGKRSVRVSIKPLEANRFQHVDPLDRGVEKLEGERRYAHQLGIGYLVADRSGYRREAFLYSPDRSCPQFLWIHCGITGRCKNP